MKTKKRKKTKIRYDRIFIFILVLLVIGVGFYGLKNSHKENSKVSMRTKDYILKSGGIWVCVKR